MIKPIIPKILTNYSLSYLKRFINASKIQIPPEIIIPNKDAFFRGILEINNSPAMYPKI